MRYAVVFKTYAWDSFVHRQAGRCAAAAGGGDFFVSVDETNGPVGELPFDRVVRTTNAELIATGFADRFEKGSLLWWNPDYVHYQFQDLYPDYDYYVFVEYDVLVQGDIGTLVRQAAAHAADLVALPIRIPKQEWYWSLFHTQTYPFADLQGSLNCAAVFSARALRMLAQRRRDMAADARTRYWPSSEVFIPTEIRRADFIHRSLEEFANVAQYDWFPPLLEEDVPTANTTSPDSMAFFHPVLDRKRYIASTLKSTKKVRYFFNPRSQMRQALKRFVGTEYKPLLRAAALDRLKTNFAEELARSRLRFLHPPDMGARGGSRPK